MDIGVIGTGYVGLVTATCLAKLGHRVFGVDQDEEKIARLRRGVSPIYEPGLEELLREQQEAGRIQFSLEIPDAVRAATVLFICVGTPPREDGSADLSQVEEVTRVIAESMDGYRLLVEKSTVPVRTSGWIERTVRLFNRRNVEFDVASNPEFLREGTAIEDFLHPDRIVIGVSSERAGRLLREIYAGFSCPLIETDVNTAEIIKHASNSFLAMKISFINMVADLCERTGADILTVAEAMGLDKRIGRAFLNAGLGYGGACFPKDVLAFIHIAEEHGLDFRLLRAVDEINRQRRDLFLAKVRQALWHVRGKTLALLGLSFKPHTDDIRGSPGVEIAQRLQAEGAQLRLYDPRAMEKAQLLLPPGPQVIYTASALEAAEGAHALLIATDWPQFQALSLAELKERLATPVIVDGRNLFDPEQVRAAGFEYHPVGRPPVHWPQW
jgi:UDPglucose 6-dehydrogenase